MKSRLLVISGLFLLSGEAMASSLNENPFLMPSDRISMVDKNESQATENSCSDEFIKEMAEKLAKEIEIQQPPQFQAEVLGKWTRQEVEESKYIGETNGTKIYFNERLKQYIYLDITKIKKKGP